MSPLVISIIIDDDDLEVASYSYETSRAPSYRNGNCEGTTNAFLDVSGI